MKKFILALLIFSSAEINAQHVAAFYDATSGFTIFDDGINMILGDATIVDLQTGNNFVAYVNGHNQFMYYYKNDTVMLEYEAPESFAVSQNFLCYKMGSQLRMVEKGIMKILCNKPEQYEVGDSIIAFEDRKDSTLKVYYNGVTAIAEKGRKKIAVAECSVSQNLVAYITLDSNLNVWWHGKTYFLTKSAQNSGYRVGTDMVAFASSTNNEFRIFYKGEILSFPKLFPRVLKANNNSIAFIDQDGHLDIFYNGQIIMAAVQTPNDFSAEWDHVQYVLNNEYKVFFKGDTYVLDSVPSGIYKVNQTSASNSKIPMGNAALFYPQSTFTFYDRSGIQNIFYKGEIRKNTSWQTDEKLKGIDDLMVFTDAFGKTTVYYRGRKY